MNAVTSLPSTTSATLDVTEEELRNLFHAKYGEGERVGPVPRTWLAFGYFPPDVFYETLVDKLVHDGTAWVDVGCGRDVFPDNPALAQRLARRCEFLVGVDPDANVVDNPFVHEYRQRTIEDFQSDRTFTLVTMRMVVEHITNPKSSLSSLARLLRPGGKVVVFTINQWSPISLWARILPFAWHHPVKRLLWRTEERDTFPVAYRMNTRKRLAGLFEAHGFRECAFWYLDDCRAFFRFRWLHVLDLLLWRCLNVLGLRHPENCLLGVYERMDSAGPSGENELHPLHALEQRMRRTH